MPDLNALIAPVLELAHAAGREIMDVYAREFDVEHKADSSPLTEADLRSQRTIVAGLERLTPGIPILAEEAASVPYATRRTWRELWLVDPLDGTREFVSRNPEFTVNIALIRDHRPVLGIVHVPAQGVDYYGAVGVGAFRRKSKAITPNPRPDTEAAITPIPRPGTAEAIRVAIPAKRPWIVVGSKSHRGDSLDKLLPLLGEYQMRPIGSSLKQCLIAEGSADFYPRLGPTMEWDTAAAQAVLECAGGRLVDTQGEPLLYNAREDLTNPHFVAFADTSVDWLGFVRAARA